MKSLFITLALFLGQFSFAQILHHWETAIYSDDEWAYFPGTSAPDTMWKQITFDDSLWATGKGGFGYGDNDDNTTINQVVSVYIRKEFNVADSTQIVSSILHMDYDDGFIAYLNGVEVARAGVYSNATFDQLATADHEAVMYKGGEPESFSIKKDLLKETLRNGTNVLAIEVHNITTRSSDLSAIAFLSFGVTTTTQLYRTTPNWFVKPFEFTWSNLPIVLITTDSAIVDEPKSFGTLRIIRNKDTINTVLDTANIYDGYMGIEVRGSYSATLPQKSYGLETQDINGENNNVKLIGMPKENDWILLANYNDKSFMRNSLPYKLFREMGHYAARTRHCEVVINDSYEGIYVLTEKLKRDGDRVDIAKLDIDDNAGDSVTGGYIFKIDYYTSTDSWLSNYHPIDRPSASVHFVYHDPTPEELTDEQKLYLQTYVDEFESVLYGDSYDDPEIGYSQFIDVSSFVDYFIIGELSRNVDAYKKSRYFFKDKESKGGLINSGPVWDFDWAWKNLSDACNIFNNLDGSGWGYKLNGTTCNVRPSPAGWMVKLMEDTTFQNTLGTRYHTLRDGILSDDYIHNYIDSIATMVADAQERHYTRWPILGRSAGAAEIDGYPDTYTGEVEKLRTWIDLRLAWLDKNMPEMKIVTPPDTLPDAIRSLEKANIRVFPNPSPDFCFVESDREIASVTVYTPTGGLIFEATSLNRYYTKIKTNSYETGIYLLKVKHTDGSEFTKKIVVKRD